MAVPQRTFAEARRLASRADKPDAWMRELGDREKEARQRVRAMDAPQREKLEAELTGLAESAKANTKAAQRLRDALASATSPLPHGTARAQLAELTRQQAYVRQRATAARQRLAALDQREERATDVVDRMAQNTGLGKPKFSF